MSVPNTFASATGSVPLANLDANFAYYDAALQANGTAISFPGTATFSSAILATAPTTVNASTHTVAATAFSLIFTTTNCTVTLPTASSNSGRILMIKTITANSVVSASSNVVPLNSATAGTAILAATAGKFAMLQSNGTNWVVMMAN